jgi:hypothetical protein
MMRGIGEMTTDFKGLITKKKGLENVDRNRKKDKRYRRDDKKDRNRRGFSYKSSTRNNANGNF